MNQCVHFFVAIPVQVKKEEIYLLLKQFDNFFTLNYDPFLYQLLMSYKKDDTKEVLIFENTLPFIKEQMEINTQAILKEIEDGYQSGILTINMGADQTQLKLNNLNKSDFEKGMKHYFEKRVSKSELKKVIDHFWKNKDLNEKRELEKIDDGFGLFSEIVSPGKWSLFCTPKVVVAGMTKKIEATLDEKGEFAPSVSVYSIITEIKLLKHILAIISSTLIEWYFNIKFQDKHLAGGYISMNTKLLEIIPIIEPIKSLDLIEHCEKLLKLKKGKIQDTTNVASKLDATVARLYGLTSAEYEYILNEVGSAFEFKEACLLAYDKL